MPVIFTPPRDGKLLTEPNPIVGRGINSPSLVSSSSAVATEEEEEEDRVENGYTSNDDEEAAATNAVTDRHNGGMVNDE